MSDPSDETIEGRTFQRMADTRDGSVYRIVTIGEQTWMAENLKYYPTPKNGMWIYDNDLDNFATYGVLYNWSAAMDGDASSEDKPSGVQGICPPGWHLPSDSDLPEYRNKSGFTALPGGYRYSSDALGDFLSIGTDGYWWSTTEHQTTTAYNRHLYYKYTDIRRLGGGKGNGYSVRCLKD